MKWQEVLQDTNGKLSLGSVTTLGTWFVASALLAFHFTETMFFEYLAAFITHRLGSKYLDKKTSLKTPSKRE